MPIPDAVLPPENDSDLNSVNNQNYRSRVRANKLISLNLEYIEALDYEKPLIEMELKELWEKIEVD